MSDAAKPSEHRETDSQADRLDSWKEIAAFLQRDVRTVQRWEKHAGLPVHRHAETRLRTAYAYRSELEAWWRAQRSVVEPPDVSDPEPVSDVAATVLPGEPPPAASRRYRSAALFAAGALGLGLVAAILWIGWTRAAGSATAKPARSPVSVLVSRFEDRGDEPRLTDGVAAVIGRQLAGRRDLVPVEPARIASLLRLTRREEDTPLGEAVARELALRDGRIAYVIAGGVQALPGRYLADLRALDAEGRTKTSVEWHGATPNELITGSHDAVRRFAELLAAADDHQGRDLLEQVTSSSTAAVRLYSQALQAGLRGQWGASEQLARRALALDAAFASAQGWVGWAMRQQGRSARECLPFLARAMAASGAITDRETYLISGMHHAIAGELPAAGGSLEALLRIDPRDRQAMDILIEVYWRMGRVRRATDLSVARAEAFPDDFYVNVRAAQALAAGKGRTNRAAAFALRANQLASPEAIADRPRWNAWLQVLPVFQQWVGGNTGRALEILDVLDRSLVDRLGRERDAFAAAVGFAHLAFGRTTRADDAFRYGSAPERQLNLAVLALVQGDEGGARQWLRQIRDDSARRPALFARVGFEREARRALDDLPPSDHVDGIAAVTGGLLALRQQQVERATSMLRNGLDLLRGSGEPAYFLAAEALAALASSRGDVDRSIRLLSDAAAERPHTYSVSQWTAGYWIRMNTDLVRQCRRAGRHDEAERVSGGLRQILALATEPAGR